MHRTALETLRTWTTRPGRKPLILRGARQVGKSHLVRMLAEDAFENMLEINLEVEPDVVSLFASKQPRAILELLEARYGTRVTPGKTLLFLDEVQSAPELLACLRYFYERMPEMHVVAAGSLLDIALQDHSFSMPVGRIEYLHLGPMTFEEFLRALGREQLVQFLADWTVEGEIPDAIHNELSRLLRRFLVVGGMPASVEAFVSSGAGDESERIKQGILSTYRDDFARYRGRSDPRRLEKVFARIPQLVGRKFMYSHVDREDRSRELGAALEMLCLARVAHKIKHSAANGIPLRAEADERRFKVLFVDVGLVCRSAGLSILDFEESADPLLVNSGAVCEQFIGQHLVHRSEPYEEPEAFCWMREKSQSSAEVDYVISFGETIVPVEVKAGKTGTLKSLHVFLRDKKRSFALRFNADKPSLLDANTSLADGRNLPFRLLSLPLYMVGQTRRLCRELA